LKQGLHWGSKATLIAIGAVTVALVVGFGVFFVAFHRVFFVGDSWLFLYTDTLIRLFPVQFWQQFFFVLAGLSLIEAAVLFWLTKGAVASA
ncbi:MAG TPA: DUF1461 domain-containing protein, partial [Anaerolineales bacterium]|nr:DUF1461 domain-containing protein [Anaerolineales bacterium]